MRKNYSKRQAAKRMVMTGFCICLTMATALQSIAGTYGYATSSNAEIPLMRSAGTGDIWETWIGDMSFLSGERGDGSEEKPFQISTKAHLMGLAELAAMGMKVEETEGTYTGDYAGAYFELTRNLDLEGMDWIPIGFYNNESGFYTGDVYPFVGHFNGNGKTISNFKIADSNWKQVGLFGVAEDAEIQNLNIQPGYILYGKDTAGILVGEAKNSQIRNVSVSGTVKTAGTAGGLAGALTNGSIVENCTADHIAVDSGTVKEVYTGGITGKASESLIVDCTVNTGDSYTARIQGGGYVGGIAGFQNSTDIFNVHVMGTIGGNGSQSIGGVTGKYTSGKMKVARFEGRIAKSGLGSMAHEGTFLGTHDTGFHFRYGTEAGADLAYLFADSEDKIAAGICGSGIPDDNRFGYDAHIGFWHTGDNFFTLVQGMNTKGETERYFFEELESGMLHITDTEESVREEECMPDHFAPNAVGRPTRGYLISVLQIDTAANGTGYYDVASLTAKGESAYSRILDKENRGAVAPGDVVTVMTAPKNTDTEKYQMDGVPTYTKKNGNRVNTDYQTGGSYSFIMPEHDTELSAVYKKVAAGIRVEPEMFGFKVIQERTGNRKHPSIVTEVKDQNGKLIARYINSSLDHETTVQNITIDAIVDENNDVADRRVVWSLDDSDLLILKQNGDEDSEGYTEKSASIELNLQAEFFQNIIQREEKEQAEKQYRYPIPDVVYGNGTQGGLAVLTAKTRPSSSFEGKPVEANCKIPVTFQIKDKTYVANEGVFLDKQTMEFVVTRTLTGNRKAPTETITVTTPQSLTATFVPDYFDKRDVKWTVSEDTWITVDGENRSASVAAYSDAKWIRDLIQEDLAAYGNDWRTVQCKSGKKEALVMAETNDMLGNREAASCLVTVRFETVDQTYLYGSSSSGGGGGGSNSGKSEKKSEKNTEATGRKIPDGSVNGNWKKDALGTWTFWSEGQMYKDTWAYVYNPYAKTEENQADWFRFDANGSMITGWFTDHDGSLYYLWPHSDGTQGRMVTGWNWIENDGIERCYYFQTVSDGRKGRLLINETTPDGYQVNERGAWMVNGTEQVRETDKAAGR